MTIFLEKTERAVVNQTNSGTVSNAVLSELPSGGWSAYGLFQANRNHRSPLLVSVTKDRALLNCAIFGFTVVGSMSTAIRM